MILRKFEVIKFFELFGGNQNSDLIINIWLDGKKV